MTDKRKVKELVAQIMRQEDIDYEDWLHTQHMIFVADHTDLIRNALNALPNKEN